MIERYARKEFAALFDLRAQYHRWLKVELAVTDALAAAGVVPADEASELRKNAGFDLDRILEIEATVRHDVVAFTQAVAEQAGPSARWLHYGLTSSDVVDTAWGLVLAEASDVLLAGVDTLRGVLARRAWEERATPAIGRTHGIHAEPTSFGLKLALFYAELGRDRERLVRAREAIAVGKIAGAVGTYSEIAPEIERTALAALGLEPETVPTQIVQRDRHAEWLFALAILGATLEKLALEVRSLQRTEVRELEEPFAAGQKGSSAMPHKRNPVVAERICGLARLLRSYSLAGLEDIALWHERDISHSSVERVALPDAALLADFMLHDATWLVEGMKIDRKQMERNIWRSGGLVFSQRVLLALVAAGLSREAAYAIVQRHAMRAWQEGGDFRRSLQEDPDVQSQLSPSAFDKVFDVRSYLMHVEEILHRAGIPEEVS
ncbi:MAG: adenylosuccinate lyase [Thermaerobacter sp.]|nr:adenylosuccinate lyase [Thermaerobacter sp.]